jgi:hypothetical protein
MSNRRRGIPPLETSLGREEDRPGVLFEKRCCACGEPLLGSGTRYCSRTCRTLMAAFEEFSTLQFILVNARWAGAPTQEQALREYLRDRMWDAVRRLSSSADVLSREVLGRGKS